MILLYHKVDLEPKTMWWVTADRFYLQMAELRSKKVVYLDDYDSGDPNQVVITFDGVYEDVCKYAVPILEHFGYPFELFVIGSTIGNDNSFDPVEPLTQFASLDSLKKMVKAGGRIQWHTWAHQNLDNLSKDQYEKELEILPELKAVCPEGLRWFAYPNGKRNQDFAEAVQQRFYGALACDDGDPTNRYDLPRQIVTESTRFTDKKVSVIIPCYNYGHLAAEAIESVLRQTYPPDEILFIDDASSDYSVEIARKYEPQIRVEVNPKNLGVIENFKKAVSMTTGDYVCFLGADNRFRSDYIEKTRAVLDMFPDVGVAYTHFALFDKRARIMAEATGAQPHPTCPEIFLKRFPATPEKPISEENFIHGSSMYRRAAYDQVGGYQTDNRPEDHSLFARILEAGWKAVLVDEFILEYRQHSRDQVNLLKGYEFYNFHLLRQIKGYETELNRLVEVVNNYETERNRLVEVVNTSETERNRLVEVVSTYGTEINRLVEVVNTYGTEINRLVEVAHTYETEINRLVQVPHTYETEINRLVQVVTEQDADINNLRNQLNQAREQIDALQPRSKLTRLFHLMKRAVHVVFVEGPGPAWHAVVRKIKKYVLHNQ